MKGEKRLVEKPAMVVDSSGSGSSREGEKEEGED